MPKREIDPIGKRLKKLKEILRTIVDRWLASEAPQPQL